jgi:hypothetical protein
VWAVFVKTGGIAEKHVKTRFEKGPKMSYKPVIELCKTIYGYEPRGATVSRWKGIGRKGKTLRTVFLAGRVCTSEEWLREFIEGEAVPASPSTAPAKRSSKRAAADLAKAEQVCESFEV